MPNVIYEILIQSNGEVALNKLTGSAKEFAAQANRTSSAVNNLNGYFTRLMERIALVGVVYKGLSEIKESYELFTKQNEAVAALTTTYENNAKYTRENLDALKEYAIKEEGLTGVYREQIDAMETSLLAHHDIRISYSRIIPAVIDYAKATGTSAALATQQLSRVLGNPLLAMRLLRQAHIDITKAQSKWMENMYNSGHYVEYQTFIVDQLANRYKGAAAQILAANPGLRLQLQWRQDQVEMGRLATEIMVDLTPALVKLMGEFKDGIVWLEKHKTGLEEVGKVVVYLTALYGIWKISGWAVKLTIEAITLVTRGLTVALGDEVVAVEGATAATEALTLAMDTNPIGLMITAIAALALAYKGLTLNADDAIIAQQNFANSDAGRQKREQDAIGRNTTLVNTFMADALKKREKILDDLHTQERQVTKEEQNAEDADYDISNTEQALAHGRRVSGLKKALDDIDSLIGYFGAHLHDKVTKDSLGSASDGGYTTDDLKGSNRISNIWNIKNFAPMEIMNGGTAENKNRIYQVVVEALTAAQRDAQIATGH